MIADIILALAAIYLGCGLLLGLPFVLWGVGRVDASSAGARLGFRLIILPGAIALWPWILSRWLRAGAEGK